MTDQATTASTVVSDNADFMGRFFKRGEVWLGIGLMIVLTFLVLPIPPLVVDFGLAISITFSVTILMTVLFIGKPLEFSSFPTVLLIATLLRLSLNLGTTRLVLTRAIPLFPELIKPNRIFEGLGLGIGELEAIFCQAPRRAMVTMGVTTPGQ